MKKMQQTKEKKTLCEKCGTEFSESIKICPVCGNPSRETTQPNKQKVQPITGKGKEKMNNKKLKAKFIAATTGKCEIKTKDICELPGDKEGAILQYEINEKRISVCKNCRNDKVDKREWEIEEIE